MGKSRAQYQGTHQVTERFAKSFFVIIGSDLHPDRVDSGEEEPGQSPVTETPIPVFSFQDGYLSVNYLRAYIDMAADETGEPLSDEEVAALDLIDEIAHDENFALKFITEPGEAVFFNNLTMLHNRTAYEDWPEPERKRYLLRLWLSPPDGLALPEAFAERYGSVAVGDRGGVVVQGTERHVPLTAL